MWLASLTLSKLVNATYFSPLLIGELIVVTNFVRFFYGSVARFVIMIDEVPLCMAEVFCRERLFFLARKELCYWREKYSSGWMSHRCL